MKNRQFFDQAQASGYLRNTVIRIAGKPVYVHDVHASEKRDKPDHYRLSYCELTHMHEEPKFIDILDKNVDMSPVPLGNVNRFNGGRYEAYFAARLPARKWKVGLCLENLTVSQVGGVHLPGDVVRDLFPTPVFINTIVGDYPTYEQAIHKARVYGGVIAFSRRFALMDGLYLFYKNLDNPVGNLRDRFKGKDPVLLPDYSYLQEALEEDIARH